MADATTDDVETALLNDLEEGIQDKQQGDRRVSKMDIVKRYEINKKIAADMSHTPFGKIRFSGRNY